MPMPASKLVVCCSHEELPSKFKEMPRSQFIRLEYEKQPDGFEPNMELSMARFIQDLTHIPARYRDLLEIAGYTFCADRSFSRGSRAAVEYQSWGRRFQFHIKVRDFNFWNQESVRDALQKVLKFMTGDASYQFIFHPGRPMKIKTLFDSEQCILSPEYPIHVALFSGGLDSLSGVIDVLESTNNHVYLVSHRSHQPSTTRTQDKLVEALTDIYGNRIHHFKFYCNLKTIRSRDENQRTRGFLYTAIAFTLAQTLSLGQIHIYENGVTAINLPKREDMGHARASRTTHPLTISLLQTLFSIIAGASYSLETPFQWKTKTEILGLMKSHAKERLISSSVSCSKTFRNNKDATHCGSCSQCIDRRISAFSADVQKFDHAGLYTFDLLTQPISSETKTLALDYVRQSSLFALWSIDKFYGEMINELVDVLQGINLKHEQAIEKVFDLHHRHGIAVIKGVSRMLAEGLDLTIHQPEQSFLRLVAGYEHLKDPVKRLADDICAELSISIPLTFQRNDPSDENDFNDKVEGLLSLKREAFEREHPAISFALTKAIADHSSKERHLLIESKYLRRSTTPSKASEAIAADMTKYPTECYLLFIVYDPHRSIKNDAIFKSDFEEKRSNRCRILIIR